MSELIENLLKELGYNGMLKHFRDILDTSKNVADALPLLQRLLEVEIEYRKTRSLMYRLNLAKLPQIKTFETFDVTTTELKQKTLSELSECKYIHDTENILLIGGSGTGKSHIALSLAYIALQQGYKVRFYKFSDLARKLTQAKEHHYEANLMAHLQRYNLLVMDEVGYLPTDKQAGSLLFELFSNLYERVSIIITTHLPFTEWGDLFGNSKATKAIIDRLTHHCKILETGDVSWRLKECSSQGSEDGSGQSL